MLSHLLVLHFGAQCPWQPWAVEQARRAAEHLGGTVHVADVARQPELAARFRLFFPFMTVVDGSIRLPSPAPAGRRGFERVGEVDRVTLREGEEVLVLMRRRLWTE
jgi:hypothetical protein